MGRFCNMFGIARFLCRTSWSGFIFFLSSFVLLRRSVVLFTVFLFMMKVPRAHDDFSEDGWRLGATDIGACGDVLRWTAISSHSLSFVFCVDGP